MRKIALILVAFIAIGSLSALGWLRMMAPIRVVPSGNRNIPIYAMVIVSSHPESFVVLINDDGDFEDSHGYLKRGDVLAMCITDGESIYWEGRIELGHFGQVSVPLLKKSDQGLSHDLKKILTTSMPWQARNEGRTPTSR